MITPELISFIKSELAKGKIQEQIRSELATGGWNASDLEEAFSFILKIPVQPVHLVQTPPTIQPVQPITQPFTPTPIAPIIQPIQPIQATPPLQPNIPIIQPMQTGFVSASGPASVKPKSHSKVGLFFVIFLIIFGGAFAGWYFFKPEIMKILGGNNNVNEAVIAPDQISENVISDVNLDYSSERWKPFSEDVLGLNFSYPAGLEYKNADTILNRLHRFTFADSGYSTRMSVGFRTFPVMKSDYGDSDACSEEICSKENFELRKNRGEVYKNPNGITFYVYEGKGDGLGNVEGTIEADFETNNAQFPYVMIFSDKIPKPDFLKILDTFKINNIEGSILSITQKKNAVEKIISSDIKNSSFPIYELTLNNVIYFKVSGSSLDQSDDLYDSKGNLVEKCGGGWGVYPDPYPTICSQMSKVQKILIYRKTGHISEQVNVYNVNY